MFPETFETSKENWYLNCNWKNDLHEFGGKTFSENFPSTVLSWVQQGH
jgi:hypothetical protein